MPKKIVALSEYISASNAAHILSAKHGRLISVDYVRLLSKRKQQPVRTEWLGNRLLYNKSDIEATVIKRRESMNV